MWFDHFVFGPSESETVRRWVCQRSYMRCGRRWMLLVPSLRSAAVTRRIQMFLSEKNNKQNERRRTRKQNAFMKEASCFATRWWVSFGGRRDLWKCIWIKRRRIKTHTLSLPHVFNENPPLFGRHWSEDLISIPAKTKCVWEVFPEKMSAVDLLQFRRNLGESSFQRVTKV